MKTVVPDQFQRLAQRLGDQYHTVIPYHALITGRCQAWASDDCIVVRADYIPDEPFVYGPRADEIAELLTTLSDWTMVTADVDTAPQFAAILSSRLSQPLFFKSDNYFAQKQEIPSLPSTTIRSLTLSDTDLLAASPRQIQGGSRDWATRLLTHGLAVGAFAGNHLVCVMHAWCITPHFADVSANTLPDHRRKGFARAAGALLCNRIRGVGRTPTWSTSGENAASQQLAAALAFDRVMTRTYVSKIDPQVKLPS